jgi:hypothetical protein
MAAKTKKGQREAALKAWKTRRKSGDPSASAKLAWKTRRKNGWVHPAKRGKKVKATKAKATVSKSGSEAAKKAWETRRKNAAAKIRVKKVTKSKKVTAKAPERIDALDVKIGDHVSKRESGPFQKVTNVHDNEHTVTLSLAGGKNIRPHYDDTLWRVP